MAALSERQRWLSTQAGAHLRGRSKRDTAPERALRSALHARGFRFRLQRHLAKGCTPDVVLPRYGLALFVDGCFWHGCDRHGRKTFAGPNADLWRAKLEANQKRDLRSTALAEAAGWRVLRLWECDIMSDVEVVVDRVVHQLQPPMASGDGH